MRHLPVLVLTLSVLACDNEAEPARRATVRDEPSPSAVAAPEEAGRAHEPVAGGISWEVPDPFVPTRPTSEMRAAEYVFPEEAGERPGTLSVFFFGRGRGGSIDDNVQRWLGQFTQPDGQNSRDVARIARREVHGLQVTTVQVSGTFSSGMERVGMGGPDQPDSRLLAAIVEGPEGPVFFKMVGPTSLMTRAEEPFDRLVESVQRM